MYRKIERSLVAGDEHGVFIERISLKLKNEKKMKKTYIVIPALNPPEKFYDYLAAINEVEGLYTVVVNDGSRAEFEPLFSKIKTLSKTRVLTHAVNQGKGAALKTAFAFLREQGEKDIRIVCADCDGQHKVKDIIRIARETGVRPGTLVLGERQFSKGRIPWKSRLGNCVSSLMFYLSGGVWVGDTQTGLRGFDGSLLPVLLSIPGQRFEYEMQVLLYCMEHHYPIHMMNIETIYEDGNKSTHFRPIQDSVHIMGVLLKPLLKFLSSSVGCAAFDMILFLLLHQYLSRTLYLPDARAVFAATGCARACSVGLNYLVNRKYVFSSDEKERCFRKGSGIRYAALCIAVALSSAAGIYFVQSLVPVPAGIAKVLVDSLLFLVSYQVQKKWVFSKCEVRYEI